MNEQKPLLTRPDRYIPKAIGASIKNFENQMGQLATK